MKRLCLLATLLVVPAALHAQNPFAVKGFSATMVTTAEGHQGMEMKIYKSDTAMRMDMPGGQGYMLTQTDTRTSYMVMGGGMCMEMTAPPQHGPNPFTTSTDAKVETSPAGTDTVDGHACKVENVTVTPKDGKPQTMKVWLAEDLNGFPVKVEMQTQRGPVTLLYKDIKLTAPDAALMTHPANCHKMPGMGGMMPH